MCPFCISTVLGVAAGTVTTGGVAALFAFARRLSHDETPSTSSEAEDETE